MSLGIDNWFPIILALALTPFLVLAFLEQRDNARAEAERLARFAQREKEREQVQWLDPSPTPEWVRLEMEFQRED